MGNVLTKTITDPATSVSRTWTYTYDSYGRRLTAKGPRTDVSSTTTYAYYTCTTGYQCGQLYTVTDPVGNITTYNTYNAHGQPLTITDPNGVVTTLTYDARKRLTSRQVGSGTTTFSYYSTGLLEQVTLPDSSYILYTYDTAHRLTQISDGAGNSIQYTLDAMGNRTAVNTYDPSSTLHRSHARVFNSLNELYQDINAAGTSAVTTTYGYDSNWSCPVSVDT
jgi:YD repeat-containing protein